MKETPMIFNGEMVRAILEGRKTITRRMVKPQPKGQLFCRILDGTWGYEFTGDDWRCPFGQAGDRICVRETWMPFDTSVDSVQIGYKASNDIRPNGVSVEDFGSAKWLSAPPDVVDEFSKEIEHMNVYGDRWRPSIHMPRWACRITLEITSIRVERLQDISAQDLIAESITTTMREHDAVIDLRKQYSKLWDSIYGNWNENPWVWVIEFRRVK